MPAVCLFPLGNRIRTMTLTTAIGTEDGAVIFIERRLMEDATLDELIAECRAIFKAKVANMKPMVLPRRFKANPIRQCPICDYDFHPTRSANQIACSPECSAIRQGDNMRRIMRHKRGHTDMSKAMPCRWCKEPFMRNHARAVYCGANCRRKAKAMQDRKAATTYRKQKEIT